MDDHPAEAPATPHPLDQLVWWLEGIEARRRELDAARLRLMAAALEQALGDRPGGGRGDSRELAYRALRAELAAAFNLSERQTESQLNLAFDLSQRFRSVLAALEDGRISQAHARVIVEAATAIGPGEDPSTIARRDVYETAVLEVAVTETPNRLRPVAKRLAEELAERSLDERQREAASERRVMVFDHDDGMADLVAHLPAVEAHAIHDRLTRIARSAERGERVVRAETRHEGSSAEVSRTREQLRADVLSDLLLAADERAVFAGSAREAIRARVQIVVSVAPGADEADPDPASTAAVCELAGYGPIGREVAGALAAHASSWSRIATTPAGDVIGVDRYRPSEEMRRRLGARDLHCRFPGCRVPVHRCDLDHTVDAAKGGPTRSDNLAFLCRGHHTLKHHGGWRVSQGANGVLRWTSPTGRTYTDRPPGARRSGRSSPVRFRV